MRHFHGLYFQTYNVRGVVPLGDILHSVHLPSTIYVEQREEGAHLHLGPRLCYNLLLDVNVPLDGNQRAAAAAVYT